MKVLTDTACGREVSVKAKDRQEFDWGVVVMCCDECVNVVLARNAWTEVYA